MQSKQPVLVGDLTDDSRWPPTAKAAAASAADDTVAGNGAGSAENPPEEERTAPGSANGRIMSALALPLMSGDEVLGATVFLSTQPRAFSEATLPVGAAFASRIVFGVQAAAQRQAWKQQNSVLRQLITGEPVRMAKLERTAPADESAPAPEATAAVPDAFGAEPETAMAPMKLSGASGGGDDHGPANTPRWARPGASLAE